MLTRLDHVGVVAHSLDEASQVLINRMGFALGRGPIAPAQRRLLRQRAHPDLLHQNRPRRDPARDPPAGGRRKRHRALAAKARPQHAPPLLPQRRPPRRRRPPPKRRPRNDRPRRRPRNHARLLLPPPQHERHPHRDHPRGRCRRQRPPLAGRNCRSARAARLRQPTSGSPSGVLNVPFHERAFSGHSCSPCQDSVMQSHLLRRGKAQWKE